MQDKYDVIIVGAGSAGCALAYRLAAKSNLEVLLLEAGSAAYNPLLHIPLGFAFLLKPHKNNWGYVTQQEPALNHRQIDLPRGKVLGGCSAINGMVYVRGQAADYDRWAELGNEGWSYSDVLPYFKRSENCERGADTHHGSGGPLWVGKVRNEFAITDAFIEAAHHAGHPINADVNAITQEGVGYFSTNIKHGRRLSSASAFLKAGERLRNLTILTHAETQRVLIQAGRAVGVEVAIKGKIKKMYANREVVLSAGAINSPKLLELSGIGQAERLRKMGIDVVLHLPGVGENLQDHFNSYIVHRLEGAASYYSESKPLPMLRNLLRYVFHRQGFLANPAALVAVFYKSIAEVERPDAQIHFAPAASEKDKNGNMIPVDGITVASCGLRPTSRGATHLASIQRHSPPQIKVNYLATEQDQKTAVDAFKKARDILAASPLRPYGGFELQPGNAVKTDKALLDYIRSTGEPVHHLAGSCKMGSDELAVVDSQLRVHGVTGLRVADSSIMPEIISGNTHAACVMIGEKAADLVLAACNG